MEKIAQLKYCKFTLLSIFISTVYITVDPLYHYLVYNKSLHFFAFQNLEEFCIISSMILIIITFGILVDLKIKKLKESESRYKDIFDNAFDSICILDQRGHFINVNESTSLLTGYNKKEILEMNVLDIVYPEDRKKSDSTFNILQSKGYYKNYQGRILTKQGEVKYIEVNSSAIYINGKFKGSRDIIRDISKQKKYEEKLISTIMELEKANRAKNQFIQSISHEIKTPLNGILGFAQLLKCNEKRFKLEDKESINIIFDSGKQLLNILNDILDFSKLKKGETRYYLKETVLNYVVKKSVLLVETLFENLNISLKMIYNKNLIVLSDESILKQILINLLTNAAKFNHQGGQVKILIEETLDQAIIEIHDTGIGIDLRDKEIIFEPFSRFEREDETISGSGLGLSIAKKLVELVNGEIGFESQPGKGSVFWLRLPKIASKNKVKDIESEFIQG